MSSLFWITKKLSNKNPFVKQMSTLSGKMRKVKGAGVAVVYWGEGLYENGIVNEQQFAGEDSESWGFGELGPVCEGVLAADFLDGAEAPGRCGWPGR